MLTPGDDPQKGHRSDDSYLRPTRRNPSCKLSRCRSRSPEAINFILGQTHFIKSVEDIHEALVTCCARDQVRAGVLRSLRQVPRALVGHRCCNDRTGTKERCRHSPPVTVSLCFSSDGFYPLNVLNTLKMVPEVCRIFCATANPTEVIIAETDQGRGILGVVDGFSPKGVEDEDDIEWRKGFLRQIGYKL